MSTKSNSPTWKAYEHLQKYPETMVHRGRQSAFKPVDFATFEAKRPISVWLWWCSTPRQYKIMAECWWQMTPIKACVYKSKDLETHNHLPSSSTTFKASITVQYIPKQSKNICTHAQIQGQDWFSWPGRSLETHNIAVIHAESSRHKAQQNSISLLPLAQILSQEAHFVRC